MFPYAPSQPRNFGFNSDSAIARPSQPWNGIPSSFAPGSQPQGYPPRPGAPAAMYETVATPQPWRATAAPNTLYNNAGVSPSQIPKPASVKHLTCYFWAKHGTCKFTEEDCLYAHRDTGKVAQGPLQVELGRRFFCPGQTHYSISS